MAGRAHRRFSIFPQSNLFFMPDNFTQAALLQRRFWSWAGLIILIYTALRVWLMISMPVSVDEATTYNYFTLAGFDYARSHYPAPNNHVLYSILTTLFYHPGAWQTVLLRLPAVILGMGSLWLFALISKRYFPSGLALMGLLAFGAMEPVIYYGYMARGYSMVLFFALASVALIFDGNGIRAGWQKVLLLALCTGLGIYAVPSYLYFGLSLALALGWSALAGEVGWRLLIKLGLGLLAGLVIAGFLYRPIIVNEGLQAITANSYVESRAIHFDQWWWHFGEVGSYFLKYGVFFFVLVTAGLLSLVFNWGKAPLIRTALTMMILMLLLPWLHGVIPFPRVWIYVSPFMIWLMLVVLSLLRINMSFRRAYRGMVILLLLAITGLNIHSVKKILGLEAGAVIFQKLAGDILEQSPRSILLHDMYAQSFLPYYLHNAGQRPELRITSTAYERQEQFEELCSSYEWAVFSNYYPPGGPLRACAVDSSWRYNLWTAESCRCLDSIIH